MMEFRKPEAKLDPRRIQAIVEAARTRALFVMMGADPNTDWLKGSMVRDDQGYLVTGNELVRNGRLPEGWIGNRAPLMLETSVPRVFAAGGHGMWGMTLGPVTGQLLAYTITSGRRPAELAPFDPLR